MPESQEAADNLNRAQAERDQACAGFHAECADLMHSVKSEVANPPTGMLSPETKAWATEAFYYLEPIEAMLAACAAFVKDERQFDPSYDIATDDPNLIRADIEAQMTERALLARNQNTTGQIADGIPKKVPAEVGHEAAAITEEKRLSEQNELLEAANDNQRSVAEAEASITTGKEAEAEELEILQIAFNQLRSDGLSTADALR